MKLRTKQHNKYFKPLTIKLQATCTTTNTYCLWRVIFVILWIVTIFVFARLMSLHVESATLTTTQKGLRIENCKLTDLYDEWIEVNVVFILSIVNFQYIARYFFACFTTEKFPFFHCFENQLNIFMQSSN